MSCLTIGLERKSFQATKTASWLPGRTLLYCCGPIADRKLKVRYLKKQLKDSFLYLQDGYNFELALLGTSVQTDTGTRWDMYPR